MRRLRTALKTEQFPIDKEQSIREEAECHLRFMKLYEHRAELAKNLPYGDQRRLEISRALAIDPQLLILDEPAAGLNEHETNELMQLPGGR